MRAAIDRPLARERPRRPWQRYATTAAVEPEQEVLPLVRRSDCRRDGGAAVPLEFAVLPRRQRGRGRDRGEGRGVRLPLLPWRVRRPATY